MNKTVFAVSAVLTTAVLEAATIKQVIVRQQWPWSTDVKVEYQLADVTAENPVDLSITAYNGQTKLDGSKLADAMKGDLYGISESGIGQFVIDPVAAFGTSRIALTDFRIELEVTPSAANIGEILYKIVSLEAPYKVKDVTRRDLLNGRYGKFVQCYEDIDPSFSTELEDVMIWTDVTNEVYKTDYIVFRRIPAAGKSYMMGRNDAAVNEGAGVNVTFARDFYIGVFELTQRQVEHFSHRTSWETNALYAAVRPADSIYFTTTMRGNTNSDWPEEGCLVHTGFDAKTLLADLQTATGLLIDLPTEAMWEYACRAGTATALYTGDAGHEATWDDPACRKIMRALAVNGPNTTAWPDPNCDISEGPMPVGSFLPNAYGLYDMLGNIREWCLDKWCEPAQLPGGTDPVGLTLAEGAKDATTGVQRGGSYRDNPYACHSRAGGHRGWNTKDFGARLCIYLDNGSDGRK